MSAQFDSLQAFFAMGGHGVYVWGCYAMVLLVMVGLVFGIKRQKKALLQDIKRWQRQQHRRTGRAQTSGPAKPVAENSVQVTVNEGEVES